MGLIENDLNPDVTIGLELPLEHNANTGFFTLTKTMLEQTKSNIKNLLLTKKGERLGNPTFGSNLHFAIFEQEGDVESKAEEAVRSAMAEWLPFVIIKDINVEFSNQNKIVLALQFSLNVDTTATEMLTFNLEPVI